MVLTLRHGVTQMWRSLRRLSVQSSQVRFEAGYSTFSPSVRTIEYFLFFSNLRSTRGPAVVHMPWWFPGAGFKKEAQSEWVPHVDTALNAPYETVKRQMARNPFCLG
jgi:hypothetical protein